MNSPLTLSFPVASFRKIPNPYQSASKNAGLQKPEMYVLICDVKDIPTMIPMKTNPREQKLTTNVAKKISTSLMSLADANFYLLNRGLLLSASTINFDNTKNMVSIKFDDLSLHGNVDGGHTYKIIKSKQDQIDYGQQYCKIEVLTGIEDFFEDLASARNTSVQVKDQSIAELEGRFDLIKKSVATEPYARDINYKEFDVNRIDISDILAILNLFNIDKFPVESSMSPVNSYSAKKTCVDAYINASKDEDKNGSINPYTKMAPLMVDIIKLFDTLEVNMADYYRGDSTCIKKYGSITGVVTLKSGNDEYLSKFYQNKMKYITPTGFLYPILGSFRALVEEKDGMYQWKCNPFQIMTKIGPTLVEQTINMSRQLGNNPNATGKSQNLWNQLLMQVRLASLM